METTANAYTYETKQQVIDAARCFGLAEYYRSCKALAQDAFCECPDDERGQDEHLLESVDGSQWIIYTAQTLDVLRFTDNYDAWQEVGGLAQENTLQQIAFYAMMADCRDFLQDLRDTKAEEAGSK